MEKVTQSDNRALRIGERLRKLRKKRGMTQEELAAALPFDKQNRPRSEKTIGRFERGECLMSSEFAIILAKALNTTPQYLLLEDDYENDTERFTGLLEEVNKEGELLMAGLQAFASLAGYEIKFVSPAIGAGEHTADIEAWMKMFKDGYLISKGATSAAITIEDMNRLQNEICDFVDFRLMRICEKGGYNG